MINSLVWATDIDVLAPESVVHRRDGYWAIHSPSNPTYWWGNFLLFDDAPGPGDGGRWEQLFETEFGDRREVTHRSFAWDRADGAAGAAERELVSRGYELEWTTGLVARPDAVRRHPGANTEVEVRALDPAPGSDEDLWEQVIQVQLAQAPPGVPDSYHLGFLGRRQRDLREIFSGGRGSWYVALLDGQVVGSLGVVVTGTRARYQTVDTVAEYRRRGIARRLVAEAAFDARAKHRIDHLVIAADPDYHAIGIYEGLGFERVELVVGALRKPDPS
jgi:ribosomal protein S18 acetylase RimI-like enzyme